MARAIMNDDLPRPATVDELAERSARLRARIDARGGKEVQILAVTKGHAVEAARNALDVGLTMLGENYAQELEAKAAELADSVVEPEWHFIGRLQRNKVRRIADVVTSWDSVDRSELLGEIAKRAPGARVLLQVNVSEEPGKGGCEPGELGRLLATAAEAHLQVDGLMTVGRTGDPEAARPGFRLLRRLCDDHGLAVCSMGMSDDLDVAVDEGSTLVRVGTALFGPRLRR